MGANAVRPIPTDWAITRPLAPHAYFRAELLGPSGSTISRRASDPLLDRKGRERPRYAHVWLGEYRKASQARVFTNWAIEEFETPTDTRF
jgi:hypothetical protein